MNTPSSTPPSTNPSADTSQNAENNVVKPFPLSLRQSVVLLSSTLLLALLSDWLFRAREVRSNDGPTP